MKVFLVSFGYTNLIVDSRETAFNLLDAIPINKNYVNGEYVYTPEESKEVTINLIDESMVRPLTQKEVENKEIKTLTDRNKWISTERDNLKKEVEELRSQLKVALTKPVESEEEEL
ncbi:hypothetical protein CCP1ISM_2710002 [Azospirillaceae bacterium]